VTGKNTVAFHRRIDEILAAQCPVVERLELPGNHASVESDSIPPISANRTSRRNYPP
jgi:hypothetical protein